MAVEIEHKFLVDPALWEVLDKPDPVRITQGYIHKTPKAVSRVRGLSHQGFLTIKSQTIGITRSEFEYEIPLNDAKDMLETLTDKVIDKWRYYFAFDGLTWEVDVFLGKLSGLILAEVEVPSEDTVFDKPDWVTEDVSRDPSYFNAVLIEQCQSAP